MHYEFELYYLVHAVFIPFVGWEGNNLPSHNLYLFLLYSLKYVSNDERPIFSVYSCVLFLSKLEFMKLFSFFIFFFLCAFFRKYFFLSGEQKVEFFTIRNFVFARDVSYNLQVSNESLLFFFFFLSLCTPCSLTFQDLNRYQLP